MRRRALMAPLAAHAALLLLILMGWAFWLGAGGLFSVDEGIAALQAEVLADTGEWAIDHPLAKFDVDGSAFPLRSAEVGEHGIVPYGKHPLYPAILSLAHGVAGAGGMVAISLLGTVIASTGAALLARRSRPELAVPTLYVTGLVSPLLFDSTLLIAHSIGAAAAAVAAVAVVRHHEDGRRWLSWWMLLALAAGVGVVLLRGEGLILAGSLAAVAAAATAATRRAAWGATAAAAVLAVVGSVLIERWWRGSILGDVAESPYTSPTLSGDGSFVSDRISSFVTTTVKVSYSSDPAQALLFGAAIMLLVALVAIRRQEEDERILVGASVIASCLAVAWLLTAPSSAVPGLLIAFPVLWFGLALGGWAGSGRSVSLLAVAGLFAAGVLATQYRQGGGLEWGFRYVAIALPLAVPAAVAGLDQARRTLDRRAAAAVGSALLTVSVVLAAMAGTTQREVNRFNEWMQDRIVSVAPPSSLGRDDGDGRPVVISAEFILPQTIWPVYDEARWLRLRDDASPPLEAPDPRIAALIEGGIDRFTFVTTDLGRDRPLLGDSVEIGPDRGFGAWTIVVVEPL